MRERKKGRVRGETDTSKKNNFHTISREENCQTGGSSTSSSSKINVNKARKSTRATATTRRTTRTSTTGSAISSTQGSKPARQATWQRQAKRGGRTGQQREARQPAKADKSELAKRYSPRMSTKHKDDKASQVEPQICHTNNLATGSLPPAPLDSNTIHFLHTHSRHTHTHRGQECATTV